MKTKETNIKRQMKKVNSFALAAALAFCGVFSTTTAFSQTISALWLGTARVNETVTNLGQLNANLGQLNANFTQTRGTIFVVSNLNDSGPGSLRQAIIDANANFGHDTIVFELGAGLTTNLAAIQDQTFSAGSGGVIALTSGELRINDSVTINGPGAGNLLISGRGASRVFNISAGKNRINVNLNGMTIGFAKLLESLGVKTEAGSENSLSGDKFKDIALSAKINVSGGGVYAANCNLNVFDSAVVNNEAPIGGGIYHEDGVLNIVRSTVRDNSSTAGGGGITVGSYQTDAFITSSLISNNSAPYAGSGVANLGNLAIINSTVTANVSNFNGAAIYNQSDLTLVNATVSHNTGYGVKNFVPETELTGMAFGNPFIGMSAVANMFSKMRTGNSIIARNVSMTMTDVSGEFESFGTNLIGSVESGQGFFEGPSGDKVGTPGDPLDPRLGELQNNGGANLTRALLGGSPAINAGNNCVSTATEAGGCLSAPLTSDQRLSAELSRLAAGRVDIGAFESIYTDQPAEREQCKNGGWKLFNNPRAFKNQGDCVQFVNTGK